MARGAPPDPRAGLALFTTLVVLLALAVLSSSVLFLAHQQQMVAHTRRIRLAARMVALSAAALAADSLRRSVYTTLSAGHEVAVTGAQVNVPLATSLGTVERLGPSQLLVRGRGRAGAGAGWAEADATVALLLRTVDPLGPWRGFPAAVTQAGTADIAVTAAAVIDGIDAEALAGPAACGADTLLSRLFGAAPRPAISAADPAAVTVASGAHVSGGGTVVSYDPTHNPALFGAAALSALADRSATGVVRPAPVTAAGMCANSAPGNWGAPLDPLSPCWSYAPVIVADGDLDVAAGTGQGILIVRGSLRFRAGSRFHGLVFAQGGLLVDRDAEILGGVRSLGTAPVTVAGHVAYDPCTIRRVLEASTALSRPFMPRSRRWIPSF